MEEKNGLNDIILNKHSKGNNTKKVLLTVATFAIILIIVVVIMNQFSGKKESALPHAPKKSEVVVEEVVEEPEFEVVEESKATSEPAIEPVSEPVETPAAVQSDETVDMQQKTVSQIPDGKDETERIYETVFEEPEIIEEPAYTTTTQPKSTPPKPVQKAEPKQVLKPKTVRPSGKYDPKSKRVVQAPKTEAAEYGKYYIQVGSFAKYEPSKAFLDKIAKRGYTYTYHKVTRSGKTLNKVLVGPFKTQSAAREALPVIRKSVEPGAFLIKL